jgi:hypothetical protein
MLISTLYRQRCCNHYTNLAFLASSVNGFRFRPLPVDGLRVGIVFGEVAVDAGLEVATTPRKAPRRSLRLVRAAKKPSIAFNQEALVGFKWKVTRGCRASQLTTFGCL